MSQPACNTPMDCFAGLPPRRGEVRADGLRLSYLEWGAAGRPLVLLHGITSSARGWWRVAPALVAMGYHVYALDMPGHGQSEETAPHDIPHIAGRVGAALGALGLTEVALIGHSWGGATALVLAASAAAHGLLDRVALIDPALRMRATSEEKLAFYLEGVGLPPEVTGPMLCAEHPDWHECDIFWKGEALMQCRARAVRGLLAESGEWDLSPRVAEVAIPLLLLAADPLHTVISPDALATAERALRPSLGRLLVIPGTTHSMHRGTGFDATLPRLTAWLAA